MNRLKPISGHRLLQTKRSTAALCAYSRLGGRVLVHRNTTWFSAFSSACLVSVYMYTITPLVRG